MVPAAIGAGAGSVIALMTWAGAIDTRITTLVPIGSMLVANAMNTNSLVLNRLRSEVESHAGLIETGLALGADSKETVAPYVQISVQARAWFRRSIRCVPLALYGFRG